MNDLLDDASVTLTVAYGDRASLLAGHKVTGDEAAAICIAYAGWRQEVER